MSALLLPQNRLEASRVVVNGWICCALMLFVFPCIFPCSYLQFWFIFENSFWSTEKKFLYFESKSAKNTRTCLVLVFEVLPCFKGHTTFLWKKSVRTKRDFIKMRQRLATTSGTWPQLDSNTIPPFRWRTGRPYIGLPPVGFVRHTNAMQPRRIRPMSRNYIGTEVFSSSMGEEFIRLRPWTSHRTYQATVLWQAYLVRAGLDLCGIVVRTLSLSEKWNFW